MLRERSTWQNIANPRQASTNRRADIYTMNQDHSQPDITDYESGNPDEWAETVGDNKSVESEYEGDSVKRDEIGMGQMRDDTFKHKDSDKWDSGGKYDNQRLASTDRSKLALRVANSMLKTDHKPFVVRTAAELMSLPDSVLLSISKRLSSLNPMNMPMETRMRRSLACAKIAARMLGESASDADGEKLARIIASLDNPTLKSIISVLRKAKEDGEESDMGSDEGHEAAHKEDGEESDTGSDEGHEATGEECATDDDGHEAAGLTPSEMAMLDGMIQQPADAMLADMVGVNPAPAQVPAAPVMSVPVVDMPVMAADVNFDDNEDEGAPATQAQISSLEDLFSDSDEVQAQRSMKAAASEQAQRASGFSKSASTGAKKLGQVSRTASSKEEEVLASLWK